MNKYDQIIEVNIGDRVYNNKDIDIDFMYSFDDDMDNNTAEISLWNIDESIAGELFVGSTVVISAGYKGDVGVVLIGEVGDFETVYHDVDTELKLYVFDGVDLWNTRINKTYEGIAARYIIEDVLNIAQVRIGKIDITNNIDYDSVVLAGTLETVLLQITEDTGSKFFIKNARGYFVDEDYKDDLIVFLDRTSGLLNSPSRITIDDDVGWKITCLLEHRISVYSHIRIESKTANGDFIVQKGSHSSDFISELEVLPI